jgi:hypothetical protein
MGTTIRRAAAFQRRDSFLPVVFPASVNLMRSAMRSFVKRAAPRLLQYRAVGQLVTNEAYFLHTTGWVKSLVEQMPVDPQGNPLPWMNFAVIAFFRERLRKHMHLFEYGSGSSTRFFAELVASVTSVEYDEEWYQRVSATRPANVTLLLNAADVDGTYCRVVAQSNRRYDVVVVDGRDRVNCMKQSVGSLTDGGVIVLDDSMRERYAEGAAFLKASGFRALRFDGLKPGGFGTDSTTVFYRPGNCLDL